MLACLKNLTYKRLSALYATSWLLMAAALYVGILPWPWDTLPGQGLSLTLNMLVWIWLSVAGALLLLQMHARRIRGARIALLLLAGCCLMSLPLIWAAPDAILPSLYRLAGIWALALFFILLLQFPLRGGLRRGLYALIVLAGLVQVCLSVWQIVFPLSAGEYLHYSFRAANGRPLGSMLHVNLLGSFLATALGCALWLSLNARRSITGVAMMLCAAALCAGVILTESRSALLAAAVVCGLLVMGFAVRKTRLTVAAIVFLAAGVVAGQGVLSLRPVDLNALNVVESPAQIQDTRPSDVNKRLELNQLSSGDERIAMLRGTMEMIKSHPLAGTGLSSFEVRFPEYLAQSGTDNPFTVSVLFPHNEILYVWSEGGVAALAGIMIWFGVWLRPLRHPVRMCGLSLTAARGVLTLPVIIHMMLEYPLYQSMVHAVTLLLLLCLAMPRSAVRAGMLRCNNGIRISGLIMSALCIVFMVTGLQSARMIREAESFRLMDGTPLRQVMNPLAQPERLRFDQAVYGLVQYNLTQNYDWLSAFHRQASAWLKYHNDASMTASMIQLAVMRNDGSMAEKWRQRGCLSFPRDPRFHCVSTSSNRK